MAAARSPTRSPGATSRAALAPVERFAARPTCWSGSPASGSDAFYAELAALIGLPAELVARRRGRVPVELFAKRLLRDQERLVGRYDGTLSGPDPHPESDDYEGGDPSFDAAHHGLCAGDPRLSAGRSRLPHGRDLRADQPRGRRAGTSLAHFEQRRQGFAGFSDSLRAGLILNPGLEVLIAHGYHDLITPYFASRYLVAQMDLPAAARARVQLANFAGGHMFYLHAASLAAFHAPRPRFYADLARASGRGGLGVASARVSGQSAGRRLRTSERHAMAPRPLLAAAILLLLGALAPAAAQEMRFFRIGTGGVAGTYYPIGGLIADIISSPPGARPCDKGGSCGVPGLVAIAQSSNGSVANVDAIRSGELESGFVQSDVAYWAYTGTGIFEGQGKVENLRAIASLYPESIHVVARKGAGIAISRRPRRQARLARRAGLRHAGRRPHHPRGLRPRRGRPRGRLHQAEPGGRRSGTTSSTPSSSSPATRPARWSSSPRASAPTSCRSTAPRSTRCSQQYEFFARDLIPAGTYEGIGETQTISVGAQWVVGAEVDEELVYGITEALWHENARQLLDNGHAKGRAITLETALDGIGIPLHPGAERFYREAGLLQ